MALNTRQELFVTEYLICWNASEAARRAGYNGRSNQIGSRLLTNVDIQIAIKEKLSERAMSANEVLARLADMARGDIANFTEVESPTDLNKENYKGQTHVIKKFKKQVVHAKSGDTIVSTELELYDAQSALEKLGRHHALFTDNVNQSGELVFRIVHDDTGDASPSKDE